MLAKVAAPPSPIVYTIAVSSLVVISPTAQTQDFSSHMHVRRSLKNERSCIHTVLIPLCIPC